MPARSSRSSASATGITRESGNSSWRNPSRLISTLPVTTEACPFLNAEGKTALLTWIERGGLSVQGRRLPRDRDDHRTRYADREIDFADATLVWLADLVNTRDVMTIDRQDFQVFRLRGGKAFNLVLP
jgi:uncharacterized protein